MQQPIAVTNRPHRKSHFLGKVVMWTVVPALAAILVVGNARAQDKALPVAKPADTKATTSAQTPTDTLRLDDPPKELITLEESNDKRAISKFKKALRDGRRGAAADKDLQFGLRIMVYQMTLKENQKKVRARLDDLLRLLLNAGTKEKNMQNRKDFRAHVCKETLTLARDLLDNNYEVRLNATVLISKLNVTVPNSRVRAEAYSPSADVLLEILRDKSHPSAVKINAAQGIKRMALYGSPVLKTTLKNELVKSIVSELAITRKRSKNQGDVWYQSVLLETLAAVNLPVTVDGKPVIYNTLLSYLDDASLDSSVRCVAAKSIGRANLSRVSQVKPDVLALKLGKLGLDLTANYNKDIQNYYHWQKCFWNLYLAFNAQDGNEKTIYRDRKLGLREQFPGQKDLNDAYEQIKPLTRHLLLQPVNRRGGGKELHPLPKKQIQVLSDWIKNHPQSSTPVSTAGPR